MSTLRPVVESIRCQNRPADQLLFIDDQSDDGTAEFAVESGFELVVQRDRRGLAAARSLALEHCQSHLLAGIDADVQIDSRYLGIVESAFHEDPELAAVCCNLQERFQETLADRWRAVHMAQNYGPHSIESPRILFGATTVVRSEIARKIGGWNESFARNYEDVDFTGRLGTAGEKTKYIPEALAWHLRRDSTASVLIGFSNWFRPAGRLAGHFDSLDVWLEERLISVIVGIHRFRRDRDFQTGRRDLSALTLLLPWMMIAADLSELGDGQAADLDLLSDCAMRMALASGATESISRWLAERIRSGSARFALQESKSAMDCERLRQSIMKCGLMDGLPDGYWDAVACSIELERSEAG